MTSAEMCAWWLMTFGAGEVPAERCFQAIRESGVPALTVLSMQLSKLIYYNPGVTDRPDYYRITEAGIEAINAGD